MITIEEAINQYIEMVRSARSENTARTYQNALSAYTQSLLQHKIKATMSDISTLIEDTVGWFALDLKDYSPSTERLYLTAVNGFFEFLASENLTSPNLPRIKSLIRQKARRSGQRLPQFPRDKIENVINHMINITLIQPKDPIQILCNLRDRAFILTLADTGLRVHEACNLKRGDIDWNEGRALIIGKGDQQAIVRFSTRSMNSVKEYLSERAGIDGSSGRPLASLPLFARHDRGAGKKVKKITTTTGRNIVTERVVEVLGESAKGTITPHSFRHYFVTTVLRGSGNLKLAQELARHKNISVTQRYAHLSNDELDQGYWDIFEQSNRSSKNT